MHIKHKQNIELRIYLPMNDKKKNNIISKKLFQYNTFKNILIQQLILMFLKLHINSERYVVATLITT